MMFQSSKTGQSRKLFWWVWNLNLHTASFLGDSLMHSWMARTRERRMTWNHPISRMSQFVLCFTLSPWNVPKSCHQLQRMCHKSISRFKLWIHNMKHCPNIMWSNETGNFTQWGVVNPLSRACSGYTQSSTCWQWWQCSWVWLFWDINTTQYHEPIATGSHYCPWSNPQACSISYLSYASNQIQSYKLRMIGSFMYFLLSHGPVGPIQFCPTFVLVRILLFDYLASLPVSDVVHWSSRLSSAHYS